MFAVTPHKATDTDPMTDPMTDLPRAETPDADFSSVQTTPAIPTPQDQNLSHDGVVTPDPVALDQNQLEPDTSPDSNIVELQPPALSPEMAQAIRELTLGMGRKRDRYLGPRQSLPRMLKSDQSNDVLGMSMDAAEENACAGWAMYVYPCMDDEEDSFFCTYTKDFGENEGGYLAGVLETFAAQPPTSILYLTLCFGKDTEDHNLQMMHSRLFRENNDILFSEREGQAPLYNRIVFATADTRVVVFNRQMDGLFLRQTGPFRLYGLNLLTAFEAIEPVDEEVMKNLKALDVDILSIPGPMMGDVQDLIATPTLPAPEGWGLRIITFDNDSLAEGDVRGADFVITLDESADYASNYPLTGGPAPTNFEEAIKIEKEINALVMDTFPKENEDD